MTLAAVPSTIISPRSAWRALLWLVAVTVLWMMLIYWQPAFQDSGLSAMAVRLTVHGLIALGLWLGLEGADLTPGERRTTWLTVMVPFTLWVAVAWSAAINDAFRLGALPLPVPIMPLAIFLPVTIAAPVLLSSKRIGQVLDAMPTSWLVALQLYRIHGSVFIAGWLHGALPGVWALPSGAGDVLTGLFAVPAAITVAAGSAEGRKVAIIWNAFGLADLAVAVGLGMITSPGPLQLIVPNVATAGLGTYPYALTPAFVVPSSILLHALSLRQLRRRSRARG
jgi:hypothetical protein